MQTRRNRFRTWERSESLRREVEVGLPGIHSSPFFCSSIKYFKDTSIQSRILTDNSGTGWCKAGQIADRVTCMFSSDMFEQVAVIRLQSGI